MEQINSYFASGRFCSDWIALNGLVNTLDTMVKTNLCDWHINYTWGDAQALNYECVWQTIRSQFMVKMCVPNWPEAKVNQFHVVHTHTHTHADRVLKRRCRNALNYAQACRVAHLSSAGLRQTVLCKSSCLRRLLAYRLLQASCTPHTHTRTLDQRVNTA